MSEIHGRHLCPLANVGREISRSRALKDAVDIASRTRELSESLEQQTATAEVLRNRSASVLLQTPVGSTRRWG